MRRIIDRYLSVNFILPFLSASLFFIVFLLTFQLFRITRIVINKDVPWIEVVELVGHIALSFVPMAVPLAVLFASLFCFNKLSDDSEIIAMRSFGIGRFRLFLPMLILGTVISLVIFSLNRNLIPYSKRVFQNTIVKLTSRGVLNSIKSGQFFTEIPKAVLFAEKVESDGITMHNVFIQTSANDETKEEQVIAAKKGILIKQGKADTGFQSIRLHLKEGNILKLSDQNTQVQKILFKEYDFPIMSEQNRFESLNKYTMRTSNELWSLITEYKGKRNSLEKVRSTRDLSPPENSELEEIVRSLPKIQLEYFSRWNSALQCLIFIFLGFCLGIKHNRGKTKNSTVYGILILIFYYVVFFTGISIASRNGVVSPFVAIFLPSIIVMGVGGHFYRKVEWPA